MSKLRRITKLSIMVTMTLVAVVIFMSSASQKAPLADKDLSPRETVCDIVVEQNKKTSPDIYQGMPAEVNFSSNPEASLYKTTIKNQVKEGVNFAGHYVIAKWGCGTSCVGYAVVDVITGNIVKYVPYYKLQIVTGIDYSQESNVLVFNPKPNQNYAHTAEDILEQDGQAYSARVYFGLVENESGAYLRTLCAEDLYSGYDPSPQN